jgi:hypothetical protein
MEKRDSALRPAHCSLLNYTNYNTNFWGPNGYIHSG